MIILLKQIGFEFRLKFMQLGCCPEPGEEISIWAIREEDLPPIDERQSRLTEEFTARRSESLRRNIRRK